MSEANIVVKLKDQASQGLNRIENTNKGFNKSLEETQRQAQQYSQRLDSLIRNQSKLQTSLEAAKRELNNAKKAFKETGSAADSEALTAANEKYNRIKMQLSDTTRAAKDTQRALHDLGETSRKQTGSGVGSGNSSASGSSGGILSQLGKAGAGAMLGDLASQAVGALAESALGSVGANYVSSAISMGSMGASIGSVIAPGIGTAVGAALGSLGGLLSAKIEEFASEDEAFKSYVQDAAESVLSERDTSITSGSSIAAQREQDVIAFNRLLGDGAGDQYLEDLRAMAVNTPMEYEDLTAMSRALATGFGDDTQRMLDLITALGDAGSAVGIDASGMTEMAKAMSRMQSSGKASLEYLNIFQDRGVDVIGMLADGLDKTKEEIYEMISESAIKGTDAAQIIQDAMTQAYEGAMDKQSQTFSGLTSTLSDAQAEMDNAYGEGYNEERKRGLQREIDYLSGESGAMLQEAYNALGAWEASLENSKEEFIRYEMDKVINSEDYQKLMDEGTQEAYVKAGEMLMEAKVRGQNEYNASAGAQLMLESEMSLAQQIREDASTDAAYWDAGYRKGEQFTKGTIMAMQNNRAALQREAEVAISDDQIVAYAGDVPLTAAELEAHLAATEGAELPSNIITPVSHAYGLERVPYNNYPALLHEGERVLTAAEARHQDTGGSIHIEKLADQVIVREDADIDRIASAFVEKLRGAMMTGVA